MHVDCLFIILKPFSIHVFKIPKFCDDTFCSLWNPNLEGMTFRREIPTGCLCYHYPLFHRLEQVGDKRHWMQEKNEMASGTSVLILTEQTLQRGHQLCPDGSFLSTVPTLYSAHWSNRIGSSKFWTLPHLHVVVEAILDGGKCCIGSPSKCSFGPHFLLGIENQD